MRCSLLLVVALILASCGFVEDERAGGIGPVPGVSRPTTISVDASPDRPATPSASSGAAGGATDPPLVLSDQTNQADVTIEQPPLEVPVTTEWSQPVEEFAASEPSSASSPEVADLWWDLGEVPPVKRSEEVFTLLADPRVSPDSACFAAWRFLRHTLHLSATPSSTVDPDVYANRLESASRSLEQLIDLTSGRLADAARDVAAVLDRMANLLEAGYGPDIIRSFGDSLIGGPGQLLDGLVDLVAFWCPTVASGRPQMPFFWAEDA